MTILYTGRCYLAPPTEKDTLSINHTLHCGVTVVECLSSNGKQINKFVGGASVMTDDK